MPVITFDGMGVVSHAGTVLLAEIADRTGLTAALSEVTDGLRERRAGHDPVGSVGSTPTVWRVLAGVANTPGMLAAIRQARARARDRAWLARGELTGTELPGSRAAGKTIRQVVIDLDATLVTAHSDKEGAKAAHQTHGDTGHRAGGRRCAHTGTTDFTTFRAAGDLY